MSVADELQTLNDNILDAYTTVGDKGGTVPTNKNTNNLATAIDSIPSGGGPTPLDPQVVYQQTRPADWLPMPTPVNNEIYLLVRVPKPLQEKEPGTPLAFACMGTEYQVELGTVTNGQFVPDSTFTETKASGNVYAAYLHYADWASNPMTDGTHQVMVRISSQGNISGFTHVQRASSTSEWGARNTLEFRGKGERLTQCTMGTNSTDGRAALAMRFFTLEGANMITANFGSMFQNCYSLTAIPQLNTSSGTNFSSMFCACQSLTAIPQLDTSEGTNFGSMFQNCYSLTAIPQLDTSKGTEFGNMFYSCFSLATIPQLDTSEGTNFSSMFSSCRSLTAIPQLDTSKGTSFAYMFSSCQSLAAIPQLDTSSGTNFSYMLQGCDSLTTIPQLDTSEGTNFGSMFSGCYSLTAIPQLDTSKGTEFTGMFSSCQSLRYIDFVGYDFTKVTSANSRPTNTYTNGGGIMRIDNKFQTSTGGFTGAVMVSPQGALATNPFYVLIEDEQTMIPLGANATTVFTTNSYAYVVVPDSMYATYAADTYWATLGTRLMRRSDVTLPAWYQ